MNKILPSILDINDLESFLNIISKSDISDLHIDIMDGVFTENKCGSIESIAKVKEMNYIADVHLMINEPLAIAKEAAKLGADCVTIHYEIPDFENVLKSILKENIKVGVSICPNTDVNVLKTFLKYLDHILIMSVVPRKRWTSFY